MSLSPLNWAEIAGGVIVVAVVLRNLKGMHELTGASPRNGEPIPEAAWRRVKQDGESVYPGDVIAATRANEQEYEIQAHHHGTLRWIAPAGQMVPSGSVIATIDDDSESHSVIVPKEYFQG